MAVPATWQIARELALFAVVKSHRLEIEAALKMLIHAQRAREFQWLAVQVGKTKWPELEATSEQADGAEDATAFFIAADGQRRRLAASLSGTLKKIRQDATRLRERNVKIDVLIFVTPVPITHLEISDWRQKIQTEFGHDLHVISEAELVTVLEQPGNAWLCQRYLGLDIAGEPELQQLEGVAREAAHRILAGWKAEFECDLGLTIELTLVQESANSSGKGKRPDASQFQLRLSDAAMEVVERGRVILVGPPGSGKTFTLIQIADLLLRDPSAPVPILISLPGWGSNACAFQKYVEQHLVAYGLQPADFLRLRAAGRIALLLNGWNEISEDLGTTTANNQLQDFAVSNTSTPLIISTRTTSLPPPLARAASIRVQPLSWEQKLAIIQRSGLRDPSKLLHSLESNPTLASVTETPLFLSAVIELAHNDGEELPATRYGILNCLIERLEQNAAASLAAKPCEGFHRRYLEGIAFEMTQAGVVVLPGDAMLNVVANTAKGLQHDGHLASSSSSTAILQGLVKHHLLVLSPSLGGGYRFNHQQFQEWFAAESLKELVVNIGKDARLGRIFEFQRDVLNHPRWFQPLAFTVERLGKGNEGEHRLAAKLIEWAQAVDLMLASELAGIAGGNVWPLVRDSLSPVLRTWYARNSKRHRRCALAAMLATGAADFSDILWPLLESDEQTMRFTCRAWGPFLFTSLGSEFPQRFNRWDEARRTTFVQEMGLSLSQEHVSFAIGLSQSETSVRVKYSCLDLLTSAGAYKSVVDTLETLSSSGPLDSEYLTLVRRLPNSYRSSFNQRLEEALSTTEDPHLRHAIVDLLYAVGTPNRINLGKTELDRLTAIPGVVFRAEYWLHERSADKGKINVGPCVAGYLDEVFGADPEWAAQWLTDQLVRDQLWEEPFTKHLSRLADGSLEKVLSAVFDSKHDVNTVHARADLLASSGSSVIATGLLKHYFVLKKQKESNQTLQPTYDRFDAVRNSIHKIPFPCLVNAVLAETKHHSDFEGLWGLVQIILPGCPISPKWRLQLSDLQRDALRELTVRLRGLKPNDWDGSNYFQASIAALLGAVGRVEDIKLIETWIAEERHRLAEEDADWRAQVKAWETTGRKGRIPKPRMIRMSWNTWCEALAQAGGPESVAILTKLLRVPEFLGDAAWSLVRLARAEHQELNTEFSYRPDYAQIYKRREELAKSKVAEQPLVTRCADAIHSAIQDSLPEIERSDFKISNRNLYEATNALAQLDHLRALPILLKISADKNALWTVAKALHELLLRGITLPGEQIADALEPFIQEHEKRPFGGNDNWHSVVECLAILLFSDNPKVGVERTRRLPEYRLKDYNVREILGLLAICHAPDAAERLVELAVVPEIRERYPHELCEAMSQNVNSRAHQGLLKILDQLANGTQNMVEPLGKAIAHAAKVDPNILEEVESRCKRVGFTSERSALAIVLHELGTERAALALSDLIHDEIPVSYHMEQLVEAVAENKVPAGSSSSYYLEPRRATGLRKRLYDIAMNDVTRRTSALELLAVIAECRLEHGQPVDEPIHPNFEALGRGQFPWQIMK